MNQRLTPTLAEGDPDPEILKRYPEYCRGHQLHRHLLTYTRCGVALAVGLLSRAMHCSTPELLLAAERVLGYLHRPRHLGLFYDAG